MCSLGGAPMVPQAADVRMDDIELPPQPPLVKRSSSFFDFPSPNSDEAGAAAAHPQSKLQTVYPVNLPAVLQLKSLLGPTVPIPANSLLSVANLWSLSSSIYGIPAPSIRLFIGLSEVNTSMSIDELVTLGSASAGQDGCISVLVALSLPPAPDSDANLGAFRSLPAELTMQILSLLPIYDVCTFSRTCKRLREVSSDPRLWCTLFARYWCPFSVSKNACCWKELYKAKLAFFAARDSDEQRVRDDIKAMLAQQASTTLQLKPQWGAPPTRTSYVNLGLLEACARRAIQFGAPAYNRRDFEACYRTYFVITTHILRVYENFTRMTPLFRKGLGYLSTGLALAKNALDDARRAWSLRHGLDSIILTAGLHRTSTKSVLNLGESYCTRHMWAEAEASISEALDMSFESITQGIGVEIDESFACHYYIFFMSVHCLLMQGKYVPLMMMLKDAIRRDSLGRLRVTCFPHTMHFVRKGISAIDSCLNCPHITVQDRQKLMLIKLYYVYVGVPTAEELSQARQYCCSAKRASTLECVRAIITYFGDALAKIEPTTQRCAPNPCEEDEEDESGDEDDVEVAS